MTCENGSSRMIVEDRVRVMQLLSISILVPGLRQGGVYNSCLYRLINEFRVFFLQDPLVDPINPFIRD